VEVSGMCVVYGRPTGSGGIGNVCCVWKADWKCRYRECVLCMDGGLEVEVSGMCVVYGSRTGNGGMLNGGGVSGMCAE